MSTTDPPFAYSKARSIIATANFLLTESLELADTFTLTASVSLIEDERPM